MAGPHPNENEISEREARLSHKFGEMLSLTDLANVLRYPSVGAVRQARRRGLLPVQTQRPIGRRGWFATARAVAEYLYKLESGGIGKDNKSGGAP